MDIAGVLILSLNNLDMPERDNMVQDPMIPGPMPSLRAMERLTLLFTDRPLPSRHMVVADAGGTGNSSFLLKVNTPLPTNITTMALLLGHRVITRHTPRLTPRAAPHPSTLQGHIVVPIGGVGLEGFGVISSDQVGAAIEVTSKARNGTAILHGASRDREKRRSHPRTTVVTHPPVAMSMLPRMSKTFT